MRASFEQDIVIEKIDNGSNRALVVLHGYGQLARYFIKKFEGITSYDIVAVQAPNLFYLNGFSGRVGANWLTKENREAGIEVQRKMLTSLANELNKSYASFSMCCFSQGVATGSRWLMWNALQFEKVLFYAGEIAPEAIAYLSDHTTDNLQFVVGENDEFFTADKIRAYHKKLELEGLQINIDKVKGAHSVEIQVVLSCFDVI